MTTLDPHNGHWSDWRVDPNQVIFTDGDDYIVEVTCALCLRTAKKRTKTAPAVDPKRPNTWPKWKETL